MIFVIISNLIFVLWAAKITLDSSLNYKAKTVKDNQPIRIFYLPYFAWGQFNAKLEW
jgi:hypothetical protein